MGPTVDSAKNWGEAYRSFLNPRVIALLFLGFSAGLPILLIFSSLSIWLRDAGVSLKEVTFFSWAALGYSFKFIWAPLVDRIPIPFLHQRLGRRRSWLLLSQLMVIAAICFLASNNPANGLLLVAVGAVALCLSSATQDIVIDAYRIEAADNDLQAMMSSTYIAGYRVGMLLAGAGTLALSSWLTVTEPYDYEAWAWAYRCMAAFMLVGVITTLLISEPVNNQERSIYHHDTRDYLHFLALFGCAVAAFLLVFSTTAGPLQNINQWFVDLGLLNSLAGFLTESCRLLLSIAAAALVACGLLKLHVAPRDMVQETYIAPFAEFFQRYGKAAIYLLLLVGTYRIADIMMGTIANVFYTDMGYSKEQIATITKTFGLFMTIAGGFMGGVLALRYGVMRMLWVGAWLAAASNVLFAVLANLEPSSIYLSLVIAADNLSGGLASAAFIAFLSGLTNRAFTAMQYAIFSSLMTLLPKLLAGYSGTFVDAVGYPLFFIGSALLGLPIIWLVTYVGRLTQRHESG